MKRSIILQRAKDKKRTAEDREDELLEHYYANKNENSPNPMEPLGDGGWWVKPINIDE